MKGTPSSHIKECAEFTFEQINARISNVDEKVSNALAFSGVLIGFILVQGTPQAFSDLSAVEHIDLKLLIKVVPVVVLYLVSILSSCFFISTILCRVIEPQNSKSHLFFGTIKDFDCLQYINEFNSLSEDDYNVELLEEIHICSKICSTKMKYYNYGIWMLFVAVILCFFCFIFNLI